MIKITKQIQVSAIADEKLRGAIGALCVHWALLELSVERVIANLEGNPEVATYTENLSRRMETLKTLAKASATLSVEEKNKLCLVAGEIKTLCHDRHRYVHGLWGLDVDGKLINVFPRAKFGDVGLPASPKAVRAVKLQTWRLYKQLLSFVDLKLVVDLPSKNKRRPKVPPRASA